MTIGLIRAFGVSGFFSLLLWVGALVVAAFSWRRGNARHRQVRLLAASVVALLALLPARSTAYRIARVDVDRREEVARAAAVATAQAARSGVAEIRFAEDTAKVRLPEPAYRQRGIQARSREKLDAEAKPHLQPESMESKVVTLLDETAPLVLRMPEKALRLARRLERCNRVGTTVVFWLALGLLVTDYLRTFHSPTECRFPLPISGPLLDRLLSKPPVMHVPAEALPALAETIIRRGETFLYCGPHAERWVSAARLPRWRVGGCAWGWVPKLTAAGDGDFEFLLDAVWFNRAFVVITDRDMAIRLPAALRDYTAIRRMTRARAAHTIHMLWDRGRSDGIPGLKEQMACSHELNVHWVVLVPGSISSSGGPASSLPTQAEMPPEPRQDHALAGRHRYTA